MTKEEDYTFFHIYKYMCWMHQPDTASQRLTESCQFSQWFVVFLTVFCLLRIVLARYAGFL